LIEAIAPQLIQAGITGAGLVLAAYALLVTRAKDISFKMIEESSKSLNQAYEELQKISPRTVEEKRSKVDRLLKKQLKNRSFQHTSAMELS